MSVITGHSKIAKRLLAAFGVPEDAHSTEIRIEEGEAVTVTCEIYPDEKTFDEEGEIETILKEYDLIERDVVDGI